MKAKQSLVWLTVIFTLGVMMATGCARRKQQVEPVYQSPYKTSSSLQAPAVQPVQKQPVAYSK